MISRRDLHKTLVVAAAGFASTSAIELLKPNTISGDGRQKNASSPISVVPLLREALDGPPNLEIALLRVTLAPRAQTGPHRHTGPLFVYLLQGSVESQVDPGQLKTYTQGEYFYEPQMHVHRVFRNPSDAQPTTLLLFEVGEKKTRISHFLVILTGKRKGGELV